MDYSSVKNIFLYVVLGTAASCIICYIVFLGSIFAEQQIIDKIQVSMASVGTLQQKDKEAKIFQWQKKISDYSGLLKNHKSSLNVFNLLESNTLPKVWFSRISLSEKDNNIVLSGETDSLDILGRQVSVFEQNEFIKNVSVFNSSIADSGKIKFNLTLNIKEELFAINDSKQP